MHMWPALLIAKAVCYCSIAKRGEGVMAQQRERGKGGFVLFSKGNVPSSSFFTAPLPLETAARQSHKSGHSGRSSAGPEDFGLQVKLS